MIPTDSNKMEQEINNLGEMMDYFSNNLDQLPIQINLCYVKEIFDFIDRVKPLYIAALALRGDQKGEEND